MTRRSGFLHALAQAQREAERKRTAQLRNLTQLQTQAAKAAEKARKEFEHAQLADQKERARLYSESRIAQVDLQNEQLDQTIARLSSILREAISVDSFIDLQRLKQAPEYPVFNRNYSGLLETCQRRGKRLKYKHDER
jgi:restriction system protein